MVTVYLFFIRLMGGLTFVASGPDLHDIGKEYSDEYIDRRTRHEITHTGRAFAAVKPIDLETPSRIKVSSLQWAGSHAYIMAWMDNTGRDHTARYENKAVPLEYSHAVELDEVSGKSWDRSWSTSSVTSIYEQVCNHYRFLCSTYLIITCSYNGQLYTPSQCTDKSPPCAIIRLGNPTPYRWAYIDGTEIYVSSWRSGNPDQAKHLLSTYFPEFKQTVVQGRLALENLAMSMFAKKPGGVNYFSETRRNLRIAPQKWTISKLVTLGVDAWRIAVDRLMQRRVQTLTLGTIRAC
jgi:hypothetical protein